MNNKNRKKIAILAGGQEQVVAIRIARELGYKTVVVDDNPLAPGFLVADEYIQTTIKDTDGLIKKLSNYNIDGVFTHAAELSIEVAKVAEALQLPGISVEAAETSTLKHKRIKRFKEKNILVPKFHSLKKTCDFTEWKKVYSNFSNSVIVKPVNNKGARFVELITDENMLQKYFDKSRDISSEYFLIEEFLSGIQYSTESVFCDGKCIRHNIADRHYDGMERYYPFQIEDGHSMPVTISNSLNEQIQEVIDQCAKALNISDGVLKGDLIIDENKIYVLEMASRTSGGRFADYVTVRNCGVNILYSLIQMAVGDPVDISTVKPAWSEGVSQRFIFLKEGEYIESISNADILRSYPGVEEIVFNDDFIKNRIQKRIDSHVARVGYVICSGKDQKNADSLAKEIVNKIKDGFK